MRPKLLILNRAVPPVLNAIVSEAGKYIPVLVFPLLANEGLVTSPAGSVTVLVVVNVENLPVEAVVAPTAVPSIAPPVILTLLAAWLAIVPNGLHNAAVPSVVKHLPALPLCDGRASAFCQDVIVPLVCRYLPALPV